MKTHDRSLEIVAVGLGQAGGNIAAEFGRRGYDALALNTAHTDLSSLGAGRHGLPDAQCLYIGLEGYDGAGSDVEYGRECIRQHADRIRDAVKEVAAGADVVVLTAGLGGGTGSNLAELVRLLEGLELPTVAITTLPHHHESGIAKVNALTGVRDLADTSLYGWALIDNAGLARQHHDAPIDSYFDTINEAIVEPIDVFNRLNDRDSTRAIRTLDGEDFRTLLLTGGVVNLHTQDLPSLRSEGVVEAVRGALTENPMMPAGFELRNVAYLGLVIEATERALHESPFSFYEEIAEQLKQDTGGAAMYLGLYRRRDDEGPAATLRLLASSNALPTSIGPMLSEAEREASAIQEKMQKTVRGLDLGGLDDFHLTRRPGRGAGRSGASAPTSSPARQATPGPGPNRPTPARPPAPSPTATPVPASKREAAPRPDPASKREAAPRPDPVSKREEAPKRPGGPVARAFERAGRPSFFERPPQPQTASEPPAPQPAPEPAPAPPAPAPQAEEDSAVAALRRLVVGAGPVVPAETPLAEASSVETPPVEASPVETPTAPAAAPAPVARPAPAAGSRSEASRTAGPDYRARFERLAQAYRDAREGDSKRTYIGRELVAALRSGEGLERLHAVAAMARLDPVFFEDALRAAADDADSHVADVAKRALKGLG